MINVRGFVVLVLVCLAWGAAFAHDTDPDISHWMSTLMQPDNPRIPCCGLSDAYWADVTHVRDGKVYAIITDDRDDAPLGRHHVPLGKQIEVPPAKLKHDAGNPTGHQIIFLNVNDDVLCFVQGSGI